MALIIRLLELPSLTANLSSQPTILDSKLQVTPLVSDPESAMANLFTLILETITQEVLFATTMDWKKLYTTSRPCMVKKRRTWREIHSLNTRRQARTERTSGSGLTTTTLTLSLLLQLTLTVVKVLDSSSLESAQLLITDALVLSITTLPDRLDLSSTLRTSPRCSLQAKLRKVVSTPSRVIGLNNRTKVSAGWQTCPTPAQSWRWSVPRIATCYYSRLGAQQPTWALGSSWPTRTASASVSHRSSASHSDSSEMTIHTETPLSKEKRKMECRLHAMTFALTE